MHRNAVAKKSMWRLLCGHRGELIARDVSLSQFAAKLSTLTGRTIGDKTGLKGSYDFTLSWTEERILHGPGDAGANPPDRPSIFTAVQEQLGLKLESRKGPVGVLVIDHVERPSAN